MRGIQSIFMLFLLLIIGEMPIIAQEIQDPEELFDEGEFFFYTEEYEEALYYFLRLVDSDPENANFNFKVGNTYMQIPGQEFRAVPYLEKAIQNTTMKYNQRSFKEKQAPHHAYFSLGDAYRMNNELQKALETYEVFTESDDFEGNYNLDIVDEKIRACQRAKIIQDVPLHASFTRLESPVNTNSNNTNAISSGDGRTIVFVTELAFYDAIHISYLVGNTWSEPEVLNPQVGSDGDMYPTALSSDGNELFMVKRTDGDNDLYVSEKRDPFWSNARPLEDPVNSRANETHASISADGQTLFFTSDRRGGQGGLDIYRATRTEGGAWENIMNLGPVINSSADEETPFLTDDGGRLYFSSQGHFNMGGFDIFYTDLTRDGKWSDPINAGYPLNTTSDDLFYYPIGDGSQGYQARIDRSGPLDYDIYQVLITRTGELLTPVTHGRRFNGNFYIDVFIPGIPDTLIIEYDREKDAFNPVNPGVRVNTRKK